MLHFSFFFFFNDTATTEIYTLSLHDALPISGGSVFLWPIRETSNSWAESGRAALQEATTSWVRLHGNRVIGGYDVEYPKLEPKPAVFPTEPFTKIIERAFKSNLIESEEHPLVKRLMGIF